MDFFEKLYEVLFNLTSSVNDKKQDLYNARQQAYEDAKVYISRKSTNELKKIVTSSGSSPKDYGIRQAALEELKKRGIVK